LFDLLIVVAADFNRHAATQSFSSELMFQRAAADVIPGAFHIALSIRQLIRAGYLFGSEILLRPFLERCAVAAYLRKHPREGVSLWSRGWPHKSRPSIKFMVGCIDEPPRTLQPDEYPADYSVNRAYPEQSRSLNRLVHADPLGAQRNAFFSERHGRPVQYAGANFDTPEYCDEIASFAAALTSVVINETALIFGHPSRPENLNA
jgi:hypothetical protein